PPPAGRDGGDGLGNNHKKPPREFTNSAKMRMVLIPAGKFAMGSPEGEEKRREDEGPLHEVAITKPFYLGQHEVTLGAFKQFVEEENYKTDAERNPKLASRWVERDEEGKFVGNFRTDETCTWKNPRFDTLQQNDEHPVVVVSWNDAWEF